MSATTVSQTGRTAPGSLTSVGLAVAVAVAAIALAALTATRPGLVPVVVVGGAVVAVCVLRTEYALLLLVAAAPLESAFQITSGSQLSATKLVGALCFASFGLMAIATGRRIVFDRSDAILLLLLAVALVSTLQARSSTDGIATTIRYGSFVGLAIVITQLVRSERSYERIIWVLSAASAVAAFLSVSRFLRGETLLAQSAYGNANDLAFVLATTVPLSLWLLSRTRSAARVLVAAMVATSLAGVVLAFARGPLLGLAVALAFYGMTERRHARLLIAGACVSALFILALVNTNSDVVSRGLTAKSHVAQYNVDTRLVAWSGAMRLAADHPLVGVGPGNFGQYYFELTDTPPTVERLSVTHDAYLDVAAELGFTGLVLFLAFIGLSFRRLSVAVRRRLGPPGLAAFTRASLVVAIVAMLTHSTEYFAPLWMLGALGTAMCREGASESSM